MKRSFFVIGSIGLASGLFLYTMSLASGKPTFVPKDGFIPDQETAIRVAEAVWIPIYGKEQIESEKPFKAMLTKGVWTVEGSLSEGAEGGVALIEISKKNGCILRVIHGK